tara:strand:+ start:6907 stop:7452 length:546 start_codon:yes stop_codon:yes gene_type:complete
MSQTPAPALHAGEVTNAELAALYTSIIMRAPQGTVFVLTSHEGSLNGAARASVPYASGEARTWAGEALDRGRVAASSPGAGTRASEATPIDELLFAVGEDRERCHRALAAAHAVIPEDIAPRKESTLGDAENALANRIRTVMAVLATGKVSAATLAVFVERAAGAIVQRRQVQPENSPVPE